MSHHELWDCCEPFFFAVHPKLYRRVIQKIYEYLCELSNVHRYAFSRNRHNETHYSRGSPSRERGEQHRDVLMECLFAEWLEDEIVFHPIKRHADMETGGFFL